MKKNIKYSLIYILCIIYICNENIRNRNQMLFASEADIALRKKIEKIIHVYIALFLFRKWRESCFPMGLQENPRVLNVMIPIWKKKP